MPKFDICYLRRFPLRINACRINFITSCHSRPTGSLGIGCIAAVACEIALRISQTNNLIR